MLKKYLVLLLLTFGLGVAVHAFDEHVPSQNDTRELQLMLAINTHLMTFANELEQSEKIRPVSDAELEVKLQITAEKVLNSFDPLKKHPTKMAKAWQLLKSINWKSLVNFIRHHAFKIKRIFQKDGLFVTTGLAIGAVLEFVVPVVLVKAGLSVLLPVSAFFPYEPLTFTASFVAKKRWMEFHFQKLYGGRENYQNAKKEFESLRKELRLGAANDIILPIWKSEDKEQAVVVSSPKALQKIFEKMGLVHKQVSFANIIRFLKEEEIKDTLLDALLEDTATDPQIKALLLIRYIEQHPNTELRDKFVKKFSNSINSASSTALPLELRAYIKPLAEATTIQDGLTVLRDLPSDLPARVVSRFVEHIAVPTLMENVQNIRAAEISALQKWAHSLIVAAKTNPHRSWGQVWTEPKLPEPKKPSAFLAGCKNLFLRMQH